MVCLGIQVCHSRSFKNNWIMPCQDVEAFRTSCSRVSSAALLSPPAPIMDSICMVRTKHVATPLRDVLTSDANCLRFSKDCRNTKAFDLDSFGVGLDTANAFVEIHERFVGYCSFLVRNGGMHRGFVTVFLVAFQIQVEK